MAEHESIAASLIRIAGSLIGERISVADLIIAFGTRAHGLALVFLAAPNLTPGPSLPGFSTLFGVPAVIVAAQMVLGRPGIWLPGFIARRSFTRVGVQGFIGKMVPVVGRIDAILKPRLMWVANLERLIGIAAIIMAVLLCLPLPLFPLLPAFGLLVLALGLLARDGITIALGFALALASIAGLFAIWYAFDAIMAWWRG